MIPTGGIDAVLVESIYIPEISVHFDNFKNVYRYIKKSITKFIIQPLINIIEHNSKCTINLRKN